MTPRTVFWACAVAGSALTLFLFGLSSSWHGVQFVLGMAAAVIGLASYVPYFASIRRGITRPHAFSWLMWAVLDGVAFAGQWHAHAGPAPLLTGSTVLACAAVAVIALLQRDVGIDALDWATLAGGGASVGLLLVVRDRLAAVVLAQVTATLGYIPTVRKIRRDPNSEPIAIYAIATAKFGLQLASVLTLTALAVIYPLFTIADSAAMSVLLWRSQRRQRNAWNETLAAMEANLAATPDEDDGRVPVDDLLADTTRSRNDWSRSTPTTRIAGEHDPRRSR